jgi:glucose/arabinose dehydrogenase
MKSFLALASLTAVVLAQAPPISNAPTIVPRPAGAQIKVPAGFSVDEYAAGFARPRFMVEGPGGEVLVATRSLTAL